MASSAMLSSKVWAVVGDVLNASKAASQIVRKLENNGKQVYKVNPRDTSGTLFKSLSEVRNKIKSEGLADIEAVNLVINPAIGVNVISEMAELGLNNAWLQPGADSPDVVEACKQKHVNYHRGCVLVEL